jgi:hypothetical protein
VPPPDSEARGEEEMQTLENREKGYYDPGARIWALSLLECRVPIRLVIAKICLQQSKIYKVRQ